MKVLDGTIVAGCSWGNDTVAMIQFLHEEGLTDVVCLYADTGWPGDGWLDRVTRMEAWARSLGYQTDRTTSEAII